jgi:predicted nucleotidyltransferase
MKTQIENIKSTLRLELPKLKAQYNVNTLDIFGSYIRNEQKLKSDIDILVSFTEVPSLFKFIELEDYLSNLLKIKVDLVMKSSLKPFIGQKILAEAQSIV